jgi:hypothetical protein
MNPMYSFISSIMYFCISGCLYKCLLLTWTTEHQNICNSRICTMLQVPFKPAPKEHTRPVEFTLLSEIRAHERAEFDNYVCHSVPYQKI